MEMLGMLTAAMSAVTLFLMGWDKALARSRGRRVPERILFLAAAMMGAAGGVAGMLLFRHKTKHPHFAVGFPLLLLVQAGILFFFGRG